MLAQYSENITLRGYHAVPSARRRVLSGHDDGVHVSNCRGLVLIEDNEFHPFDFPVLYAKSVAGRTLDTPVVSGNVSFYNENPKGAVDPTPMVGMVGLIDDASNHVTQGFKKDNDVIVLLGRPSGDLAGSEYLYRIHRLKKGNPAIDIEFEKKVQAACLEAIAARLVRSAHDLSEGGLAVGVAESCISTPEELRGAVLDLDVLAPPGNRLDEILFGEAPSRIVLTVDSNDLAALENIAARHSVPCFKLGSVAGDHLVVKHRGSIVIELRVQDLSDTWRSAIPRRTGMPSPTAAGVEANLRHIYHRIQDYIDKNWD